MKKPVCVFMLLPPALLPAACELSSMFRGATLVPQAAAIPQLLPGSSRLVCFLMLGGANNQQTELSRPVSNPHCNVSGFSAGLLNSGRLLRCRSSQNRFHEKVYKALSRERDAQRSAHRLDSPHRKPCKKFSFQFRDFPSGTRSA